MEFVEQLKSSIDIVRVIGEYVRLRKAGAASGRWVGLCPFHTEKTPSFSVNQTRQFYKCFGCGVSGDAIKFVMEIEGFTFPEALRQLAERNGIPMPRRSEFSDAESRLRASLFRMHEIAAQVFHSALLAPAGQDARAYLERRGLTSEPIETFAIGYSEPSGNALARRLTAEGFPAEHLDVSGLVRRRNDGSGLYDYFRGRLMFPIHNESGKVIAFGGRALREGDEPKYLNSPETPIYRKTSVLYNLHRAKEGMRKNDRAVLVEGYMDVIGVCAAGVKEVVASCGTALTSAQVRAIRRHTETIAVNFDPDAAGANAAERAIQILLDESMHVRVVTLEEGLDPDEYVKQRGVEAYQAKLAGASSYFHWLADRARARYDTRTAEGRMEAFKFLLPSVQKIPDKLERAAVAGDLAAYLNVDAGLVLDQFRKAATDRRPAPVHQGPAPVPALERLLLNAILSSGEALAVAVPSLTPGVVDSFVSRDVFRAVANLAESGAGLTFSALEGRLNEAGRALLHAMVSSDDTSSEEAPLEVVRACLGSIESAGRRKQRAAIEADLKSAEREGRIEEALQLMAELDRMDRREESGETQ